MTFLNCFSLSRKMDNRDVIGVVLGYLSWRDMLKARLINRQWWRCSLAVQHPWFLWLWEKGKINYRAKNAHLPAACRSPQRCRNPLHYDLRKSRILILKTVPLSKQVLMQASKRAAKKIRREMTKAVADKEMAELILGGIRGRFARLKRESELADVVQTQNQTDRSKRTKIDMSAFK
jgi:hypothetical protein